MPVRWDAATDQLLLLKILETTSVAVDTKAVSAAWPTDQGDVPTPRAISERLAKIRSLSKANGAGHFSIGTGSGKKGTPKSAIKSVNKVLSTTNSPAKVTKRKAPAKVNPKAKVAKLEEEDSDYGDDESAEKLCAFTKDESEVKVKTEPELEQEEITSSPRMNFLDRHWDSSEI